jgi:hypothetical protein
VSSLKPNHSYSAALTAVVLLLAASSGGCDEALNSTVSSLRSPARISYAPTCVRDGIWLDARDCPDDATLTPFAYVTNEESAALVFLRFVSDAPRIVDTRIGVPGVTPVRIGERPRAVAASVEGAFVLTANTASQDVSIVQVERAVEVAAIPLEQTPVAMVAGLEANTFWLAYASGRLELRSLAFDCGAGPNVYVDACQLSANPSLELSLSLELEASPRSLLLDPTRPRLYVSYGDVLYLSVIGLDDTQSCSDSAATAPCEVLRLPGGYSCADGIDNDGDGFADGADPQCYGVDGAESPESTGRFQATACNDLEDNDGDGLVDLYDPGCVSPNDAGEEDGLQVLEPTACTNGLDDDGDGLVDNRDPDCMGPDDDSEGGRRLLAACMNGLDDDDDGNADFPLDADCSSPFDDTESPTAACGDGLDNDGDGLVDLDDPGCSSLDDRSEDLDASACSDGQDNDGDGLLDLADPDCYGSGGDTESAVARLGLGPMGIDPQGRWLYVIDPAESALLVIDLVEGRLLDAGSLDPFTRSPGIGVARLPMAVVGDVRESTLYSANGVTVERDEAVAYVTSSAGAVYWLSIHQSFRRYVDGFLAESVELPTLRLADGAGEYQASASDGICTNAICAVSDRPVVAVRQRATVMIGSAGELQTSVEGQAQRVPADEILRDETWRLSYEGVLTGGKRSDGVFDPVHPGVLSSRVDFCNIGAREGDLLVLNERPDVSLDTSCAALSLGRLEYRVAHVRPNQLVLEATGKESAVEALPSRTCFPFSVSFELRPEGQWYASPVSGLKEAQRDSRRGICVDRALRYGSLRIDSNSVYRNAFWSTAIDISKIPAQRDVTLEFKLSSGFSALRRSIGPMPSDAVLVDPFGEKRLLVPDAGSNQLFVFDVPQFSLLDSL